LAVPEEHTQQPFQRPPGPEDSHLELAIGQPVCRIGFPGVNVKKTSLVCNPLSHQEFFFPLKTVNCVSVSGLLFTDR
jgi:hypothetical protein